MTSAIQPASSNVPKPKRGMPKWGPQYLEALHRCSGVKTRAAVLIGLSYSAVYRAALSYTEFGDAVDKVKALWDDKNLAALEEVSMIQAMKPGNITERIFNLKALNPNKYREKVVPGPGKLNIVFGFTIPGGPSDRARDDDRHEIAANATVIDAEEVRPTPARRRRPPDDILGDDDVDIEL